MMLEAISNLKTEKLMSRAYFFQIFFYCTDLLRCHLSILFTSMINHGYAPPEFLHSSRIPLPKGARAHLSNSDMYRCSAISILLSKMFDNVIIERQQDF